MPYCPSLSQEKINSFWSRVCISEPSACWPWKGAQEGRGAKSGNGYGVVWFNGKRNKAHRLACYLTNGPIPDGMVVCHKCDNPKCCNPSHLFIGTVADNVSDMIKKGRANKESGSNRYNAKLTESDVAEIKAQAPFRKYGWGRAMAKKYGVGPTAINNVIRGRRWRQIGGAGPIEAIESPHRH